MFPRISHEHGTSAMRAELRTSARKSISITEVLDGKHDISYKARKLCRAFFNIHYPGWNKQKVN